uniref:Integrase catalytic domain-containing protein n=1 Tax=Cannabis sativa TaxID=3483 RepID=A0A803P1W3_CANSA
MSETILGSLAQYNSSYDAWRALEQRFANQSKARLLRIKSQLSIIQKGNLSITDYYDKVKLLADSLSSGGHPLDDSDLIMHMLNGLGPEYDPVVVHVTSLVDILSLESIQSMLLTHESRLERHYTINDSSSKIMANLTVHNSHSNSGPSYRSYAGQGCGNFTSNRSQGRSYGRGNQSIPCLLCQVCHKSGHTRAVCHYRFDKKFITPKINETRAYLAEIDDQEDPQAYSSSAIQEFADDHDWYADTRATNHIAQGVEYLESKNPYSGSDTLAIGIGKRLPISHIGHPAPNVLAKILATLQIPTNIKDLKFCEACKRGKSHKLPYSLSDSRASQPLELVHTDVWGPSHTPSKEGHRYYIHFIDDFGRFTWIFPLSLKSQSYNTFLQFKVFVEKQFGLPIKSVQSDCRGEYRSLASFLSQHGVHFQHPCPHDHEQNGRAERKHRHITETGFTLLAQSGLSMHYWWLTFQNVVYVINRLPTKIIGDISPYECLFHNILDYKMLKLFGCACYPHLRPYNSHKLSLRSEKCIFVGYSLHHKGYLCENQAGRMYIARNVTFNEEDFPTSQTISPYQVHNQLLPYFPSASFNTPMFPTDHISHVVRDAEAIHAHDSRPPTRASSSDVVPDAGHTAATRSAATTTAHIMQQSNLANATPPIPPSNLDFTAPNSQNLTSENQNLVQIPTTSTPENQHTTPDLPIPTPKTSHNQIPLTMNQHSMITRSKAGIHKPKAYTSTLHPLPESILPKEPTTLQQALSDPLWLVAKGYSQTPGIDYIETFRPVVKPATVRVLLTLAVSNDWPITQLDISNAFLNRTLKETVFMTHPPGFVDPQYPTHVCRLNKALYGLKQAPRAWNEKLKLTLCSKGFHTSRLDNSLFISGSGDSLILLLVYVDDILITGPNSHRISTLITEFNTEFDVRNLSSVHYFLGVEVVRTKAGMHLSQSKYITTLLSRLKMDGAKPCPSPTSSTHKLSLSVGDPFHDPSLYRKFLSALVVSASLFYAEVQVFFYALRWCSLIKIPITHRDKLPLADIEG